MEDNQNEQNTQKNNKLPYYIGGAIILLLIVGGLFFSLGTDSSDQNTNTLGESTQETSENDKVTDTNDPADETDGKLVEIEMQGGMYYFSTEEITVNKGDTVHITLTSEEGMHNIVIDEFNVQSDVVNEGEAITIEFVADKAGEFEYYCSVGNHRQMGMVGTLIVEE